MAASRTWRRIAEKAFFVAITRPSAFWVYAPCVIEVMLTIRLVFGIFTVYVGWLASLHLPVAIVSVYKVTGGKWLWNIAVLGDLLRSRGDARLKRHRK